MRCEQCGEREATVNLASVVDGVVGQEHLCRTCMDGRFGAPPSFDDRPLATAFPSRERRRQVLVQPGDDLTLWRGTRLLGQIDVVTPPVAGWLVGLLVPAEGHPPLANVDQRASARRRGLEMQSELPADALPWANPQRSSDADASALVTLSIPVSMPACAPPECRLLLRDAEGQEIPASSIMLTELRLVDGLTDPFRARAPATAIQRTAVPGAPDREHLWYVVAELDREHRAHGDMHAMMR